MTIDEFVEKFAAALKSASNDAARAAAGTAPPLASDRPSRPDRDRAVRRGRRVRHLAARLALLPTALVVVLVVYVGCMLWTIWLSFTELEAAAELDCVGLRQYDAPVRQRALAWSRSRTSPCSACCSSSARLVLGFLLAVIIDQRVRAESVFRTIFLYPYSM